LLELLEDIVHVGLHSYSITEVPKSETKNTANPEAIILEDSSPRPVPLSIASGLAAGIE
jgi:hypothetical protein